MVEPGKELVLGILLPVMQLVVLNLEIVGPIHHRMLHRSERRLLW